jgi:nicotinate phosphoribosyltransferase
MVDPGDPIRRKRFCAQAHEDLLVPVFRRGERVYDVPDASAARARTAEQMARLDPSVKRLVAPYIYPVGIERELHELRTALIARARRLG